MSGFRPPFQTIYAPTEQPAMGAIGFPLGNPFAGNIPSGVLAAGDGVDWRTKKALVDLGLNKAQDFTGNSPQEPAPSTGGDPKGGDPKGGDPTRRVTQEEYDRQKEANNKRMNEKWLQYKTQRR